MRIWMCAFAFLLAVGDAALSRAFASVQVQISLSRQSMNVNVDGAHHATWAISSGKQGFGTPSGTFRPQSMNKMHYSRRYNMTPMPNSIFFYHGIAIHGTSDVRTSRPHRIPWLHQTESSERQGFVRAGWPSRDEKYQHHRWLLTGRLSEKICASGW